MIARCFAMLLVLLGAVGCPSTPPAPPPQPVGDAGPGTCRGVCERMRSLSCPAGAPTAEGEPCETVCENVQASGFIAWDLGCRTSAPSCEAMDRCEQGRE